MNARLLAALCLACSMSSAYATDSVPLCSPPLEPECVHPNWGQIDPIDDMALAAPSARPAGSANPHMAIGTPVALDAGPSRGSPATLKAVIDGTKRFRRETARLTDAVKRARFDRDGKVVRGGPEIVAAAEAARRVATNYALTLYIQVPAHLRSDQSALLIRKIASINELLSSSGRTGAGDGGKPLS